MGGVLSDARGATDLWVKFLESGATLNLTANLHLELPSRAPLGGLAISPDGSQIAFAVRSDPSLADFDTWVIPGPIGGVPRKMVQHGVGMQWAPDGARIAYVIPGSMRGDALAVAASDGSGPRIVIAPQGARHIHWPAWSRDGQALYFIYTFSGWDYNAEPSDIFRVSVSGGTPEPVVRSARRAVYPVPMPGGDLIYAANPDTVDLALWWRPADGGAARLLTTGVGEHMEPRLSADGRKLVATLAEVQQWLALIPIAAPTQVRPIGDGYAGDLAPSFDPNGGRIVFSSARSGHRNIWTSRPDGSQATPLTTEAAIDQRPVFSPDGQTIAFVSDRSGQPGIWVMGAEGGAPKLLVAVNVLEALTWSRDGKRILFATAGGDLPAMQTVTVADGRLEPFTTPAGGDAPAWSPTEDVIAYLEPTTISGRGPSAATASRMMLRFVDAQGRPLFPDLPPQQFTNGTLAWSHDGRRLAAISRPANGPATIWIGEPSVPASFRKLLDLRPSVNPLGITWVPDGSGVVVANQQPTSHVILFDVTR